MAFHIQKEIGWAYGTGKPPYKYSVAVDLWCALLSQTASLATFSLTGTVSVTCNSNPTNIPWSASDYALLNVATNDPADYPFGDLNYYQRTLPFVPDAPQSYLDAVLIEFRGDIQAGSQVPHAVSLYVKGQGLVQPTTTQVGTRNFSINTTFDLPLTGNPQQDVLIWNNSYCNSPTTYAWDNHQVWANLFNFDYRPMAVWNGYNWASCNRSLGWMGVWDGSDFVECRTENYPNGTGNPPTLYRNSNWYNQAKTGQGG